MSGKSKKFGRNARRPSTKARKAELRWQKNARLRLAKHDAAVAANKTRTLKGDAPQKGLARDLRRRDKQLAYAKANGLEVAFSKFDIVATITA